MLIDKIKYILFLTTSSTYSDYNQIHQLGRIKCKLHDKKEGDTLYKPKKTTTKKHIWSILKYTMAISEELLEPPPEEKL